MRVALLILVPLLAAGCMSSPGGLGFAGDRGVQEPFYKEYREILAGEHHKDFVIPVEAGANVVNVSVSLRSRAEGIPLPNTVPAQLHVTLLAPDGSALDEASLDARAPDANLTANDVPPGQYLARVDGLGASQPVDGQEYGASYVLATEVTYTG